jgi:hypothetical protein
MVTCKQKATNGPLKGELYASLSSDELRMRMRMREEFGRDGRKRLEFAAAAAGHSVFLPSRTQLGPHRITQAICCVVVVGDGGVDSLIRERFGGVASTHADKHTHTHHPCSLSHTHTHT